ncbi:MAG: hypothetical protein INQ03_03095 [Candidatus Heimdallarchaeota archaeon]|nr:hypothetical protein [Candidatus Heimdallarchaeota archaeon]
MEIEQNKIKNFINLLISRGLGIYGLNRMQSICKESHIELISQENLRYLSDDYAETLRLFMINYSKFNIVARMTVIALAKQYEIPVPSEVRKAKREGTSFRRIIRK